jgi:uncharacterized protein YegJ (DUF2314 family)
MKKIKLWPLLLIWTSTAVAQQAGIVHPKKNRAAVKLERDDAKFLALKKIAQAQLVIFIDSLKKYKNNDNYHFVIKSDLGDGVNHEHMWTAIFEYKNGVFGGLLIDSAFVLKNIKKGDKVFISKGNVEDWVIYDSIHKKQTGYFSEKYLHSKI